MHSGWSLAAAVRAWREGSRASNPAPAHPQRRMGYDCSSRNASSVTTSPPVRLYEK